MVDKKKKSFELSPMQKKWLVIAGIGAVLFVGIRLVGVSNELNSRNKPIVNILTDRSSKELGMESLIAQIKVANDKLTSQSAENARLKKNFDNLKKELLATKTAKQDTASMQQSIREIKQQLIQQQEATNDQITKLTAENSRLSKLVNNAPKIDLSDKNLKQNNKNGNNSGHSYEDNEGVEDGNTHSNGRVNRAPRSRNIVREDTRPFMDRPVNVQDPTQLYAQTYSKPSSLSLDKDGNSIDVSNSESKISVISENSSADRKAKLAQKMKKADIYLPTGTMINGVLLNGIYAPTGVNAKKDPFPVVMRVQDDAILPNMKRADLRECFLTLSGYGDMSSERALLRGETLSCVANDNSIIETKFPSFAVGEDGKAGIGGKLITRNGKALRNTLLAGFLSGVSESFETNKVQKLDISGTANETYTNALDSHTLNNGVFSGSSKALNKLADYYMSMAEQTFPVIEVNAGREVSVTLTSGTSLSTVKESPEEQDKALLESMEDDEVEYPSLMDNPNSVPNLVKPQ